ncbi:MAG: preprotein translocase subunit SecY [Oscillospiraceae bacterium]|nr:preprotein translocase subunit SecY [Oscillospiraceae bacterium]
MIQTVRKAWGIPELRKKITFTLLILLIYRIGSAIPVPFIDGRQLEATFESMGSTFLGLLNMMTGGALSMATLFALGIQPYINSSIIIQLLTVAIPALERMQREGGEEGKKKIQAITRYSTVAIALLQAWGYYSILKSNYLLESTGIWPALVIIVSFVAGSSFLMWLGEQVNEFGVGNGISMILFAGIISRIPSAISGMMEGVTIWSGVKDGLITREGLISSFTAQYPAQKADRIADMADQYLSRAMAPWVIPLILLGVLLLIVLIVFVSDAERRIPVQYAKRQVGRKMYGGQSTHLPMKVNMSGVLPIIFAQSIASLPVTIWTFVGIPEKETTAYSIYSFFDSKSILYMVVYFLMIIGFSYFYSTIQFNPIEISNNLKKNGGFIPGFRPGKPTSDFIAKVLSKITLFGAIYLGIVAIVPLIAGKFLPTSALAIGGTSVIIVVGVALETVQALESQMLMRQYKGFLE